MTVGTTFVAELLNRSAAGYAGIAASRLLEREPVLGTQSGALEAWKLHLGQRAIELAAALAAAEPRLFTERVLWSRKTFAARGQSEQLLRASIQSLRDALVQALPANAQDLCVTYIDEALQALAGPAPEIAPSELDPKESAGRLALQYLQFALEGQSSAAIRLLVNAVHEGLDVRRAYLDVLLPAQREIGRLWHANEVSVAEEHIVSATTRAAMAVLVNTSKPAAANGGTMLAACVPGNTHDLGLAALTDLFQLAGWRTVYLGADVPINDLPASVENFQADLVVLGSTLSTHLRPAAEAIKRLRASLDRPIGILVGGAAFDEVPTMWKRLGADAYAGDFEAAMEFGVQFLATLKKQGG